MKQIRYLFFACLFFFGSFFTYAQETKLRIAVIDLYCTFNENDYLARYSDAKEITSILITELVNTRKYRVLEKSKIEQIIKEQGFQSEQMARFQAIELG